jgi:hypothetical protein
MVEPQMNENSEGRDSKAPSPARSDNEVALELLRFVATTTGYGKSPQTSAGFSGKPQPRTPEDQADALLALFGRCRRAVRKE